jgi:hypothetical protein
MITHTAQAKNAVKWIDSLKGGKKGFKKGIEALGTFTYGESIGRVKDGHPQKYCCLGVACRTLNIKPDSWRNEYEPSLVNKLGLHSYEGTFMDPQTNVKVVRKGIDKIVDMNDDLFGDDETFTNVRAFILKHLDVIFVPPVAEMVKKHYGK